MKKIKVIIFSLFIFHYSLLAQTPETYGSSNIYMQLKKLNVLGSVLYVAAHPDDENNSLLPYLAKEKMYRTGYLSLTRGEGGQNLIGSEQGIELGLIRTQELLAARRIDGSEQFFTRAYEFGFSKSATEALSIWDHDKILSDVVWVIRKFQPDIIITRFPQDARAGHGHHWASAILANEAYTAAADSTKFTEQFKYGVKPWQAKRIFINGFNFGSVNTTSESQLKINAGVFNPFLGESYGEIGGEARTMHKSQGEGRAKRKGDIIEYFATTGGDTAKSDLMDNIDISWKRIKDGDKIEKSINEIIAKYNFEHPENSVHELVELYKQMRKISWSYNNNNDWVKRKLDEVQDIIMNCSGIFAEATTQQEFVLQSDSALVNCFVNKRNNANANFLGIDILNSNLFTEANTNIKQDLQTNKNYSYDTKVFMREPATNNETQPYWLQQSQEQGSFAIKNQKLIGKAWNDPLLNVQFSFLIDSVTFNVIKPVQYKYVDPVRGEVYQPFVIMPAISMYLSPHIALRNLKNENDKANRDSVFVIFKSNFTQKNVPFTLYVLQDTTRPVIEKVVRDFEKDKIYTIGIPIKKFYNPIKGDAISAAIRINLNGKDLVFSKYFKTISYNHIPDINYSFKDATTFINEEVKVVGKKVGYIIGAGDLVPDALKQMGYEISFLNEADVNENNLKQFDAIVVGIRAYNIYEWLSTKNEVLNNYVKNGGNLIVQYMKSNQVGLKPIKVAPYKFIVNSGSRVTEEDAKVNFLLPDHPALNYPNKITDKDFEGWIQERSTYQAEQIDSHYEMPLEMNDTNEKQSNGSLLISKYGKGNFVYLSLVMFRQLPAGVPGAYRLMANLIALPKNIE